MSFAKPLETKQSTLLQGAKGKAFVRRVREQLGAQLEEGQVRGDWRKIKLKNQCVLYGPDGKPPLFFCQHGKNRTVLPTLLGCWSLAFDHPSLRRVVIPPNASKNLINGADVMLPGVLEEYSTIQHCSKGDVALIYVAGNPDPIAVGTVLLDFQDMVDAAMRGKGIRVDHVYQDTLWKQSTMTPNSGFLSGSVVPLEEEEKVEVEIEGNKEGHEELPQDDGSLEQQVLRALYRADAKGSICVETFCKEAIVDWEKQLSESKYRDLNLFVKALVRLGVVKSKLVKGKLHFTEVRKSHREFDFLKTLEKDTQEFSQGEIDEVLEQALLDALSNRITADMLPLPISTLYSDHMKAVETDPPCDIKASSYKKLSKFLYAMRKEDMFTLKEHHGVMMVSAINAEHPLLAGSRREEVSIPTKPRSKTEKPTYPQIHVLYRPKQHIQEAMMALLASGCDTNTSMGIYEHKRLFEMKRIRAGLSAYLSESGSCTGSAVTIGGDEVLALIAGSTDSISKKMLMQKVTAALEPMYTIVTNAWEAQALQEGNATFRRGKVPPIRVDTKKLQGRKVVTLVRGLQSYGIGMDHLSAEYQRKFACSCAVKPTKDGKELEIVIQGHVVRQVIQHLSTLGLPSHVIQKGG